MDILVTINKLLKYFRKIERIKGGYINELCVSFEHPANK